MQKINKSLLCIGIVALITKISTCCYASVKEYLPNDTPSSEQYIDKVALAQQHYYDVSLSVIRNLSMPENVSSNEDSILIPDNSKRPEDSIPQEAILANSSDPDYLFLWHDSQGNVNWIDEQGFLNRISKEGVYYWTGPSGKKYCITKRKNSVATGVEEK